MDNKYINLYIKFFNLLYPTVEILIQLHRSSILNWPQWDLSKIVSQNTAIHETTDEVL